MQLRLAVAKINNRGILLVFPLQNRREPASLWSEFFPKTKMRWEWDDGGDSRVPDLWHMREALSRSDKVVYAKWYRGRATLFSREAFVDCLGALGSFKPQSLGLEARRILKILGENSPLSTKALKREAGLQGKNFESTYTKALNELWRRLLIVGYGEIDDGAFPSLAIGATEVLFEDLMRESRTRSQGEAELRLTKQLGDDSPFLKELHKIQLTLSKAPAVVAAKIIYGDGRRG